MRRLLREHSYIDVVGMLTRLDMVALLGLFLAAFAAMRSRPDRPARAVA
jgi:hypothetical protein